MESLIHAFGIDIKLITIQVINFVVLAGALTYFLYKPILKILNDREETIKLGVKNAEQAAEAKEKAEEERKGIVAAAHKEADAVSKRSEDNAKEAAVEITTKAEAEAAHKIKLAEEKAEALAEEVRKKNDAEIAQLAALAAEKVLRNKNV